MGKTGERKDGKLSVQALIPAADAEGALDFGQDNVFTEIVTTRGSIGFGKNTDQDFNVFFNITEDHVKDSLEAGALVDYARATFAGLDRRVDGILEVIDPANVRLYFPKDRPLSTGWSKGRVVLIGDAAHPCFQYTGLGAAMQPNCPRFPFDDLQMRLISLLRCISFLSCGWGQRWQRFPDVV